MNEQILTLGKHNGNAIEWIAVLEDADSVTLLSREVLFESEFGEDNNFANSTVLKKLLSLVEFTEDERAMLLSADEFGNKITLASYDEALEFKHKHRLVEKWCWLRSPYPSYYNRALLVNSGGSGSDAGTNGSGGGVRPVIKIRNHNSRFMKELNFRIQRQNNLNDIFYEDVAGPGNGRHQYTVFSNDGEEMLLEVLFQKGARNTEGSVYGVLESDLLEIVRSRLQFFQEGEYKTRENACALTHIEEALMWLSKRADDRAKRGVLGTMEK